MSNSAWQHLDWALAIAEMVLVPISLVALAWAMKRQRLVTPAFIFCVIVAATLAQPFGVKAITISPEEYVSGHPVVAKAEAVHSASVLGVPLFGFAPYSREALYRTDTSPRATFKVRSWLWPGLLTNADHGAALCGEGRPCWEPGDSSAGNLELVRAGGMWRYRILRFDGTPVPPRERDLGGDYRLAVGITSWAGVVYWLILIAAAVAHRRRRRAGEPQPVPAA